LLGAKSRGNALVYRNKKFLHIYFCHFAVHSLPHLTVLSLSGCSKITDDGVELIAENLQKLRALDLSWCPRITDAALEYIACDLNMLEELTLDRFVFILCDWSLSDNQSQISYFIF
jgi:hypothetical protein